MSAVQRLFSSVSPARSTALLASSNAAIAAGATWAVVSCQQNPKLTEAIVAALQEADDLIKQDPRRAAELYIQATSEKMTPDELVEIMRQPGTLFSPAPHGVMLQAEHLAKVGVLKTKPTN
ncbi:hypothetical protein [Alsobacter soli]|uniref:hypothetical protein n=1 Tax=Alsobacter soli TaxID=2109933 RepID=UPI0011B20C84|nr:hypothetical protein [Alsobacter soli]